MDYKDVEGKYIDPFFKFKGERFQYKIEYRGACLHIIEMNFKPNTEVPMSMPVPLYNQFVEWLNNSITEKGVLGNNVLPKFTQLVDAYRRDYLGKRENLKASSYMRYSAVFYLFWKATKGLMGFECELKQRTQDTTITQENGKTNVELELLPRGYYIKPKGRYYVVIIDKSQKKLGDF